MSLEKRVHKELELTSPITTDRLVCSPWRPSDLDAFYSLFSDPEVMWWGPLTSLDEAKRMLDKFASWNFDGHLASKVTLDGNVIGNVCLKPASFIDGFEVAYHFGPAFRGNGYATECVRRLCEYAGAQLDLKKVFAAIVPENAASRAVALRCGFKRDGEVTHADRLHELFAYSISTEPGSQAHES